MFYQIFPSPQVKRYLNFVPSASFRYKRQGVEADDAQLIYL